MRLSVIVPCYNEAKTIYEVVKAIKASPVKDCEIIIVDDGSTDGTREILSSIIQPQVAKVEFHAENQGKGAALRTGISLATGDIVIIQDADLEYSPQDYPLMIQPILDNKADVVFGSRFVGNQPHRVVYYWHMLGNQFLTTLSNMFTNINLTDMETCYKAFRREIVQAIQIEENRFGFEPEITAKVAKTKCRIYEVGISYYGRTYDEGKKIGWKDGVRAIYCIFRYNLFGIKPPRYIPPSGDSQVLDLIPGADCNSDSTAQLAEQFKEKDFELKTQESREIVNSSSKDEEKAIKHQASTFSLSLSQIFFLAFIFTFFQVGLECISSQQSQFSTAYLKLSQWDSLWYEKIVDRGYYSTLPPDLRDWGTLSNVAFFPGYPLFAWLIKALSGLSTKVALIFSAQVACGGFWIYFLLILKQWRIPRRLAIAAIIMILVYPGSLYLVSAYSESLFLVSLLGLIYWTGSSWKYGWIFASLSGVVMSATRIVGIPLALYPLIQATFTTSKSWRQKINSLLISGISSLGGLSFLAFCQWKFGQWDLYLVSQRIGWGVIPDYKIFGREWFLAWIGRKFTQGLELETDAVTKLSLPTSDEFSRLAVIFILLIGLGCGLAEVFFAKRLGENNWRSRLGLYFCSAAMFYISSVGMANRALSSMIRHGLPSYTLLILAIASLLAALSLRPTSANSTSQSKSLNYSLFFAVTMGVVLALTLLFSQGILGIRFSHGQWVT